MLVNVTQEHIDKGCGSDACCCPIAYALIDCGCNMVTVAPEYAHFFDEEVGYCTSHRLPPEARQFIADFDNYLHVNPFSFEVEP